MKPSSCIGTLAAALFLCACTTTPRRPDANAQKSAAGQSALDRKLAENPDDARVNLALGDRAAAGGDWLRAEQYYERAEALGAASATVVPRLVRVLVQAQRYDEALARCKRRLGAAPADRATRLVAAAILTALDRPREAEHELTTLQRTRPDDPNPYLALGKLYRDSFGDAGRARAMFERYLVLAPHGEEADAIRYQLEEATPLPDPTTPAAATPAAAPSPAGAPSSTAATPEPRP
jgi:tetratricopeptide (TPR) repeat protein